jgi:cyclopropane-fatty-acyl-phospholipid synthase
MSRTFAAFVRCSSEGRPARRREADLSWREKFQSGRAAIAEKYGERFCRMWDYYLSSCAAGFRSRQISVGQFVLSPKGALGGWARPA